MKVALLISGYFRTFRENIPNIKKNILTHFERVDVYIHFTKNAIKEDKYLNTDEDVDFINDEIKPTCLLCEDNYHFVEDKKTNDLINSWFKYYKLNEIKKENEERLGEYDLVIKYRPDLNIISNDIFSFELYDDTVFIPRDSKVDKSKLSNIDDKYLCDILAYGKSKSMDKYFRIYEELNKLIEKYNTNVSESLLYKYLNEHHINYELKEIDYTILLSKCNVFAIAGDSGSGKTTLANLLKLYFNNSFLLECDRYHKWERGDEKWQTFTHLNPEANFIAKMKEDIFDLKIGKTIYQVDYDHATGKFTDKQEISTSDNLIVCGLHSLYADSDSLYNLRIFIDTDDSLKKEWKINRDTKKRGYTLEKILSQIEDRKQDYLDHILPQKDNSDLVINFFPKDSKICLRLLIHKKFELNKILAKFKENNIAFITNYENSKFNELIFMSYSPNNFLIKLSENCLEYYDYILYVILNLK